MPSPECTRGCLSVPLPVIHPWGRMHGIRPGSKGLTDPSPPGRPRSSSHGPRAPPLIGAEPAPGSVFAIHTSLLLRHPGSIFAIHTSLLLRHPGPVQRSHGSLVRPPSSFSPVGKAPGCRAKRQLTGIGSPMRRRRPLRWGAAAPHLREALGLLRLSLGKTWSAHRYPGLPPGVADLTPWRKAITGISPAGAVLHLSFPITWCHTRGFLPP
jgi:hypothetical protein